MTRSYIDRVWNNKHKNNCDSYDAVPFCTLSHNRNISSPPTQEPEDLSILHIRRAAAPGDSRKYSNFSLSYVLPK